MCNDAVSLACQKVGRFLYDFALMEQDINERIIDILQLKGGAADVVAHSLDFFKKVNILRIIALDTAPTEERKPTEKLFSAIAAQNDNRILMAHCPFEPSDDQSVQFRRTVAKDGKVKVKDPLWSKKQFDEASADLNGIREKLNKLKPRLTFKVVDGRSEIFSHYLYAPFSTWVPHGDDE